MRKEESATKLETKLLLVVHNFLKIPGWGLNKRYELWYNLR